MSLVQMKMGFRPSFGRIVLCMSMLIAVVSCTFSPGKIVMTQDGLKKWSSTFVDDILDKMQASKWPPVTGWEQVPLMGNITYTVSNLKLISYTMAGLDVSINDKEELVIVMSGFNPDATFNWEGRKHTFPHFHDKGTGEATLKDVTLSVNVHIGRDARGLPEEDVRSVLFDVKDVTVHMKGGDAWLINLFVNVFKTTVIRMMEEQGTIQGNKIVQQVMAEQLARWQAFFPFDNGDTWDMRMTADPQYTDTSVGFNTECVTRYMNQSATLNQLPTALPSILNSRDVQIFLHEEVITSLFSTGTRHGYYNGAATPSTVIPAAKKMMSTSFWAKVVPGLRGLPTQSISANVATSRAPFVKVFPAALYIEFLSTVTVVGDTSGHIADFTWKSGYSMTPTAGPRSNMFIFKFGAYNQTLEVANSSVGKIPDTPILKNAFKLLGKGAADTLSATYDGSTVGIPTPLLNNVQFKNVEPHYEGEVLAITADFEIIKE